MDPPMELEHSRDVLGVGLTILVVFVSHFACF